MVEHKYGLGADKLLYQERRRTDFARGVFDDRFGRIGARVGSCEASSSG
jgi:hypothetical protein